MKKISLLVLTLSVLITGVSVVGVTYKKSKDKDKDKVVTNEILEDKPEMNSTENSIDNTEEKSEKPIEQTNTPNKIVNKVPEKPVDKLAGTKNKYINRLKSCEDKEKNIHALAEVDDGYSNPGMKLTASKVLTVWDDELNVIYKDLKSKMSPSDFKKLESEQIQWIKDRDTKAIDSGKEYEGESLQGLMIILSKGHTTRDRCYEIVNEYMK